MSSTKIVVDFLKLENENHLFTLKNSNGDLFWDYVRYDVFYHLLEEKKIFKKNVAPKLTTPIINKVISGFRIVFNDIVFFIFASKRPVLFFTVSRNTTENAHHYDSSLSAAMDKYKDYYCLESFSSAKFPLKERLFNRHYVIYSRQPKKVLFSEKAQYEQISLLLNNTFRTNRDWAFHIASKLEDFENQKKFYRKVLKRIKPQIVFFTRNGNIQSLVSEGHKLGIKVYEIQHGSITPASLFYNYPKGIDLNHLTTIPDGLLTFGSYWNGKVSKNIKTITVGNNQVKSLNEMHKTKQKCITIISGKYVFKTLIDFTCKVASLIQDYIFYFKLHPGEKDHIQQALDATKGFDNIVIIYDEESVETLLSKSVAILVIQSTSSYIALHMGLEVIILKSLYYEESSDIFELDGVHLIDNEVEVKEIMNKQRNGYHKVPEFFVPFKYEIFDDLLKSNIDS